MHKSPYDRLVLDFIKPFLLQPTSRFNIYPRRIFYGAIPSYIHFWFVFWRKKMFDHHISITGRPGIMINIFIRSNFSDNPFRTRPKISIYDFI